MLFTCAIRLQVRRTGKVCLGEALVGVKKKRCCPESNLRSPGVFGVGSSEAKFNVPRYLPPPPVINLSCPKFWWGFELSSLSRPVPGGVVISRQVVPVVYLLYIPLYQRICTPTYHLQSYIPKTDRHITPILPLHILRLSGVLCIARVLILLQTRSTVYVGTRVPVK